MANFKVIILNKRVSPHPYLQYKRAVPLQNSVRKMRIFVFNFFSIVQHQNFEERGDGQVEHPSPCHTCWRIPPDTAGAKIRYELSSVW